MIDPLAAKPELVRHVTVNIQFKNRIHPVTLDFVKGARAEIHYSGGRYLDLMDETTLPSMTLPYMTLPSGDSVKSLLYVIALNGKLGKAGYVDFADVEMWNVEIKMGIRSEDVMAIMKAKAEGANRNPRP